MNFIKDLKDLKDFFMNSFIRERGRTFALLGIY